MTSLAIIGTGIAGLGCAHFLHQRFDLMVFEQNDYPGGHTNTIEAFEAGRPVPIDTGFMVFNHVTYPLLTRLFRELEVAIKPTNMSFSVQHVPTGLEYNGGSLNLLFAQRRNLLRPRYWRMLMQIDRFNREAVPAINEVQYSRMSLRDYVAARGYGHDMLHLFVLPMGCAVWSTPPDQMLDFPAVTLLRFWHNHGMLGLHNQHAWFTVEGGARSYVRKLTAPFQDRVQLGARVVRVRREPGRAFVTTDDGVCRPFDKVILACHADQALALLADPTALESRLLREFKYQPNTVTLHTDDSLMPRLRRCWASWNYRLDADADGQLLPTTHYWMNRLQGVSPGVNYFVSLNCHDRIAPGKVVRRIEYAHPLFNLAAIDAQAALPKLNQSGPGQSTYYAGAWFKHGFHEDGLASALASAQAVTGEPLWT